MFSFFPLLAESLLVLTSAETLYLSAFYLRICGGRGSYYGCDHHKNDGQLL